MKRVLISQRHDKLTNRNAKQKPINKKWLFSKLERNL